MNDRKGGNADKNSGRPLFSRIIEDNKFVFIISLIIAVVGWMGVSMFQATETEKTFSNIKVQLNLEDSMPVKNGLQLFGESECFVDVTVKGKSYVLNDPSFADKIAVSASLSSVSAAGTYSIPLTSKITDTGFSDAEITYVSKTTVSLYFDESVEKTFELGIDIKDDNDGYSLPEGYVRENPRLSTESITLKGPALEINRITAVNAVVELNKELTGTEQFEAKIVPVGSSQNSVFPNVVSVDDDPVFVTINVSRISEYTPVVTFKGMPNAYKTDGVPYKITPEKVKINVSTADTELLKSDEIVIGTVDFSQLNNELNRITLSADALSYSFMDDVNSFSVEIDMSGMEKRWLEVPVSTEGVTLPEGATLSTTSIKSVQVVGPAESVMPIDEGEVLAVPVLDNVKLQKGANTVPVKITLRTLTDSWVRGEYTVTINVK